jgi:D-serine deaminase-like pyridoxal phosphate-dependent protein
MPASLHDLETPCLVADCGRLEANAGRMRARAEKFGVRLRPHVKTTKSADIARIAHGGIAGPITVSTLKEAEYFLQRGFRDICYAVAISPNKFAHAADLVDRGADLKVLVSSEASALALAAAAGDRSAAPGIMLEIDSGEHRTGFSPAGHDLILAARHIVECPALHLDGLLTHGGHSYAATSRAQIVAIAEEERESLLAARRRLESAGISLSLLSSGSTPTATFGENFSGIDELRPGVYLAGDLFQAQLGSVGMDDIAITVLASVIAHDIERNTLVIDAGGLALSKDRSTEHSPIDYGYGLLLRADGTRLSVDAIVHGVHQEHGEVGSADPLPFAELPIGGLVRVMPNHACMTAAGYDRYFVTDGPGLSVVGEWDKTSGW